VNAIAVDRVAGTTSQCRHRHHDLVAWMVGLEPKLYIITLTGDHIEGSYIPLERVHGPNVVVEVVVAEVVNLDVKVNLNGRQSAL
jgi:hypothetical protein